MIEERPIAAEMDAADEARQADMRNLIILRIGYWALVFALTAIAALVARQQGGPTAAWLTIGAGLLVGYVVYTQLAYEDNVCNFCDNPRSTSSSFFTFSRNAGE